MTTSTGGPTSRIGFGLAAVGRPAYITSGRAGDLGPGRDVERLRALAHELLDTAHAAGVRYVDVARSYGLAEDFAASWLAARPGLTDVVVGSKWGYRYVGEWRTDATTHEVKDHSLAAFSAQYRLSRELLGDRLAIYHIHSLTPDSPALTDRALHRALAVLRESGCRVGFSTSGPGQGEVIRRALELEAGGLPLFTSVETTWNLLEPSAGPALAEAARAGVTVIVKEAVANGRLSPAEADPHPVAVAAREVAAGLGAGLDQVAIAAALAQPWAWRVLSGAVTTAQLGANLGAAGLALGPGTVEHLTGLAQDPAEYWSQRSARAWS
ncbi:aldo/keto reductase [Kineosporia sp. J2-2]|uniref:Aldo/keto reductase n=1 Tax=Kineosporia corallincola TaxID=2835133 RepID=A0ABS5TKS7_9ACTN|nr:aldo/keto reductase [Kineosporia corallincola]MBT0771707.1 aldo/keto reductase [Kineosporia corallincola]